MTDINTTLKKIEDTLCTASESLDELVQELKEQVKISGKKVVIRGRGWKALARDYSESWGDGKIVLFSHETEYAMDNIIDRLISIFGEDEVFEVIQRECKGELKSFVEDCVDRGIDNSF